MAVRCEQTSNECIIHFTVRKDFKLPQTYLSEDLAVEDLEEILTLGAATYEKRESWIRRLGSEEVEGAVMAEVRRSAEEKISKASSEVEMLRRRLAEAIETGRADVDRVRRDVEAAFGGKIAALAGQVEMLESARRSAEKEIRERVVAERDEMWGRVEQAGALRVSDLERRLALVEDRRRELEEKLSARMASAAAVGASSALRGAAGEADFGELLAGAGLVAESTGKQSHMCDYRGVVGGMDVFYEVKNHLSVLREAEVTKFLRDMKEHPEVAVGVFCALQLGLPGTRRAGTSGGGIVVEWLEDRRMVIYVGELLVGGLDSAVETMKVVRKFVEAGVRVRRMLLDAEADGGEGARVELLIDRIERARGYVEIVSERARGLFNKMRIDQKAVAAIHESSLASVKMLREEIKMCVGALLGEALVCDGAEGEGEGEGEGKEGDWIQASSPSVASESIVFIPEAAAAPKPARKRGVKKATTPTCQ